MRDKCNVARVHAGRFEQSLDAGYDAVGHPAGGRVRGRDLDTCEQLARRRVDGNNIGERPADVDPYSQLLRHERVGTGLRMSAVRAYVTNAIVKRPSR